MKDNHLRNSIKKILFLLLSLQFSLLAREINIDAIVSAAKKTDKHTLVFLHKTDCGYCDSMIIFTLDDDAVRGLIEKEFVFVDINISDKDSVRYKEFAGNGREFAQMLGYDFYPSTVFIDTQNEVVFGVPGKQEENDFFIILNYVKTMSYKTMDLQSYGNIYDFEKEF